MDDYIYISGALYANKRLKESCALYERLGDICENAGHNAYVPHKHTHPELTAATDPVEVYNIDSARVMAAKAMIVVANEPSFGAGLEVALAAEHFVPLLCVYHKDARVSRYLRGFVMKYEYGRLLPYINEADMAEHVVDWLNRTFPQRGEAVPHPKVTIIK